MTDIDLRISCRHFTGKISAPPHSSNQQHIGVPIMPHLHALAHGVTSVFSHTILLVEDEEGLRICVAEYLEECGYHVFMADNVAEAKTVLNSDTSVDLVFSDVNMSGKETGFDLEKWLRLYRPQPKVILPPATRRSLKN
jgi:PleD family two-component response regulator